MAVVKSPKNIKRKKLWIKNFSKQISNLTLQRRYLNEYNRSHFNFYRKLVYRRKKNLLAQHIAFLI